MQLKTDNKILFELSFIGIFFMYFNLIPISGEAQPIIVFIAMIFSSIIFLLKKYKICMTLDLLLICIHILIVIIYFVIHLIIGGKNFIEFFRIIIGPLMYITILNKVEYINYSHIKKIVYFILSIFIIQFFKIPFFIRFLEKLFNILMPRNSIYGVGTRGLTILTPEPSYFAYFAMLLLYSLDFIKIKNKNYINETEIIIIKFIIIIISLMTKSALVYVFILIYLLKFIKLRYLIKILPYIFTSILIALFVYFKGIEFNNRFIEIISRYISFKSFDIKEILFFSEPSVGSRLLINYLYVISIFEFPFGMGIGVMRDKWLDIAIRFNIPIFKNPIINNAAIIGQSLNAQAYIPHIIGTLGFLSLPLILFIFKCKKNNNRNIENKILRNNIKISLFVFLVMLQSNLVNPIFWILISIVKKLEVYENEFES